MSGQKAYIARWENCMRSGVQISYVIAQLIAIEDRYASKFRGGGAVHRAGII